MKNLCMYLDTLSKFDNGMRRVEVTRGIIDDEDYQKHIKLI